MIEFGKPFAGWVQIRVKDEKEKLHSYSASYLTDIPMDLLSGAINMLKYGSPFILEIDTEENGYYTFINSPLQLALYVIRSDEVVEAEYEEPIELAEYIFSYITENKKALYDWLAYEDDEDEKIRYKNTFDGKIEELKKLIEERKKRE